MLLTHAWQSQETNIAVKEHLLWSHKIHCEQVQWNVSVWAKKALINNKNNNTYLQNPSSKKTIYIGGLFGLDTSRGGWNSAVIIPAVQMAFEKINNSSKVLKDFHLELLIKGNSSILMMQVTEILAKTEIHAKKLTQQEEQNHYKISTWKRELKSACKKHETGQTGRNKVQLYKN